MQKQVEYQEAMVNGVKVSPKQIASLYKKYSDHYQGRVKLVADLEHTDPYFLVEHDPGYNIQDHYVWMDKDGMWHCNCTGYHTRKWCCHIFAVLFERGY